MISLITVRSLKTVKHSIDEYACCFMYFSETNKNDQSVFVEIIKEVRLINNLKINTFINNDILDSKFIKDYFFKSEQFIRRNLLQYRRIQNSQFLLQNKYVGARLNF